jgi:hypothetical protein
MDRMDPNREEGSSILYILFIHVKKGSSIHR